MRIKIYKKNLEKIKIYLTKEKEKKGDNVQPNK